MLNPVRHLEVFDPSKFKKSVDVIGLGATGSRIALELAKLGVKNLRLWDDDHIESHNVANQIFGEHQIGNSKAETIRYMITEHTGIKPNAISNKLTPKTKVKLGQVVFLLTDTMSSRKEIWDKFIKGKCELMIETRMDADQGIIHAVNPKLAKHVKAWERTLYNGKELIRDQDLDSVCSSKTTVGATAALIIGHALWQFAKWNEGGFKGLENIVVLGTRPTAVSCRMFK